MTYRAYSEMKDELLKKMEEERRKMLEAFVKLFTIDHDQLVNTMSVLHSSTTNYICYRKQAVHCAERETFPIMVVVEDSLEPRPAMTNAQARLEQLERIATMSPEQLAELKRFLGEKEES